MIRVVDEGGIVESAMVAEIAPGVIDVRISIRPPLAEVEITGYPEERGESALLTVEWGIHEDAYGSVPLEIKGIQADSTICNLSVEGTGGGSITRGSRISFIVAPDKRPWRWAEVVR